VAIPNQPQVMHSIAATVRNSPQQPVARAFSQPAVAQPQRMRAPVSQAPQRGRRMESRSGNSHLQRRG
jgi:hypothetical protein